MVVAMRNDVSAFGSQFICGQPLLPDWSFRMFLLRTYRRAASSTRVSCARIAIASAAGALPSILPLSAAQSSEAATPGGTDPASSRVVVDCDLDLPKLVDVVRRTIEGAIPQLEADTGYRLPEGERLVFHLFGDRTKYETEWRRVGVTPDSRAVTVSGNAETYVLLGPRVERDYLEAVAWAPERVLQLSLHEAYHQFLLRTNAYEQPNVPREFVQMYLPTWYFEGMAEFFANRALTKRAGAEGRLSVCSAWNRLKTASADDRLLPLDELFGQIDLHDLGPAERQLFYDQSHSIVAFLRDTEDAAWSRALPCFEERLREPWPRAETSLDIMSSVASFWQSCLDGRQSFEREWLQRTGSTQTGDWRELWWSSQWVGEDLVTAGWTTFSAVLHCEPVSAERFTISCELSIYDFDRGDAIVFLRVTERPLEMVFLRIGNRGELELAAHELGEWQTIASEPIEISRNEAGWTRVSAQVEGQSVEVELDGKLVLTGTVPPSLTLGEGYWGLGSHMEAVRFRRMGIERDR